MYCLFVYSDLDAKREVKAEEVILNLSWIHKYIRVWYSTVYGHQGFIVYVQYVKLLGTCVYK